jgi:hypothetical protein
MVLFVHCEETTTKHRCARFVAAGHGADGAAQLGWRTSWLNDKNPPETKYLYTQSPIIKNGHIRKRAEILGLLFPFSIWTFISLFF